MNYEKTGALIRALRREKGLTQRQLAGMIQVSDKAVSKWERGQGCPDVSLVGKLSGVLEVSTEELLSGELTCNEFANGNMKKTMFYVCPSCGHLTMCTGKAAVFCCGRRLQALTPVKAGESERLKVEKSDGEWFITSDHEMTKENYILFVAFLTASRLEVCRQYPEWSMQMRLPCREHGQLMWYIPREGLMYQLL